MNETERKTTVTLSAICAMLALADFTGVINLPLIAKVAVFFTVSAVLGYTLKRNRNGRRTDGQP
jgi:hypothetical protein